MVAKMPEPENPVTKDGNEPIVSVNKAEDGVVDLEKASEVQSLLFDKKKFTAAEAKKWAIDHGYTAAKVDTGDKYHRIRQHDPKGYKRFRISTENFPAGVKAIFGFKKAVESTSNGRGHPLFKAMYDDSTDSLQMDERMVYYVVLSPYEIDGDNQFADPYDIRKACHRFMDHMMIKEKHMNFAKGIYLKENYLAPYDMVFFDNEGNEQLVKGDSWIVGLYSNPAEDVDGIWGKIKSGEYSGISFSGLGDLVDPTAEELEQCSMA